MHVTNTPQTTASYAPQGQKIVNVQMEDGTTKQVFIDCRRKIFGGNCHPPINGPIALPGFPLHYLKPQPNYGGMFGMMQQMQQMMRMLQSVMQQVMNMMQSIFGGMLQWPAQPPFRGFNPVAMGNDTSAPQTTKAPSETTPQ